MHLTSNNHKKLWTFNIFKNYFQTKYQILYFVTNKIKELMLILHALSMTWQITDPCSWFSSNTSPVLFWVITIIKYTYFFYLNNSLKSTLLSFSDILKFHCLGQINKNSLFKCLTNINRIIQKHPFYTFTETQYHANYNRLWLHYNWYFEVSFAIPSKKHLLILQDACKWS